MADEAGDDQVTARAALNGKRAALVLVIAMTVAFILATAVHVIPAVFGAWVTPIRAGDPGSAGCVRGLRDAQRALEMGDLDSPEGVHAACSGTPEGLQAWASFERLRVATGQVKDRDPAALAWMKRDLAAHLPSDLR